MLLTCKNALMNNVFGIPAATDRFKTTGLNRLTRLIPNPEYLRSSVKIGIASTSKHYCQVRLAKRRHSVRIKLALHRIRISFTDHFGPRLAVSRRHR